MRLENAIFIDASPEKVWHVTIDVEHWPQWTRRFSSVDRLDDGPWKVGSSAVIRQPGLPLMRWEVTSLRSGECFTWESRVRGLHLIATHELKKHEAGTLNVLRLELHGVLAVLLWPLLAFSARRSLQGENADLKARCEEE